MISWFLVVPAQVRVLVSLFISSFFFQETGFCSIMISWKHGLVLFGVYAGVIFVIVSARASVSASASLPIRAVSKGVKKKSTETESFWFFKLSQTRSTSCLTLNIDSRWSCLPLAASAPLSVCINQHCGKLANSDQT